MFTVNSAPLPPVNLSIGIDWPSSSYTVVASLHPNSRQTLCSLKVETKTGFGASQKTSVQNGLCEWFGVPVVPGTSHELRAWTVSRDVMVRNIDCCVF